MKGQPGEEVADVHPNAAGLDIGAREIWVCVPAERDTPSVRVFGTFTPDLRRLVEWLLACGVDTVALILLANACRMACGKKGSRF